VTRPLNFLHLTTFYPPYSFGGDAIQVRRLAGALAENGHHVEVVHCLDSYHVLHPGEPPIPFPEHPGVIRHALQSGYKGLSPLLTQQTGRPWLKSKALAAVLRSRVWDVIHFHNISLLGPAILAMEPAGRRAVKLYTSHEHWLICPTHVLWKFNEAACEKPDCLMCTLNAKRPPQLWRYTGLLERMARHVDQFVSPSRFTARLHAERGFPREFDCLPNFMDRVDEEWRNPGPRPQERPYFLFVGRLEAIKGLQTLIPIWDRAPDCDLLVAGTGTQEQMMQSMAASNPHIKFLGPVGQKDMGALQFHALACVIPSVTYETFGMASVEAFARKTPVIARDLGGLPEVVRESGGGFVYRSDAELLDALQQIAHSPALRDELGEKGYEGFVRLWCREPHLDLYFKLLNTVAKRKFGGIPWSG
jgi:glycosyltransferase involved in cell wall biosynthesis